MSKAYKIFFLLSILQLASYGQDEEDGLSVIQNIVTKMSSDIKAENIKKSPVDGWYTITKGAYIAYISADGRHLIQGDMYDIETQENLSENIRNDSRKAVLDSYSIGDMIIFSPAEKNNYVTVFTDVDCTFCRRLHNQIDDYLDLGIEVRYLMYPRSGPRSGSRVQLGRILRSANWCSTATLAAAGCHAATGPACRSAQANAHSRSGARSAG